MYLLLHLMAYICETTGIYFFNSKRDLLFVNSGSCSFLEYATVNSSYWMDRRVTQFLINYFCNGKRSAADLINTESPFEIQGSFEGMEERGLSGLVQNGRKRRSETTTTVFAASLDGMHL